MEIDAQALLFCLRGGLSHGIEAVTEIAESGDDITRGVLAWYQGAGRPLTHFFSSSPCGFCQHNDHFEA
jgi:hypothetical protein